MRLARKLLISISTIILGLATIYFGFWSLFNLSSGGYYTSFFVIFFGFVTSVFGLAYLLHKPISPYEQRLPGDARTRAAGSSMRDVQREARSEALGSRGGVPGGWMPPVIDSLPIEPLEKER